MARPLRFQYPGAVYHLMARGDGGKRIFLDQGDHYSFLHWLAQVCGSHGWKIHAWVLMANHFHLLLETPEPNLSVGMRVLLSTYSQAWNSRHQRHGHVFQGRYKAIPVTGDGVASSYYFKIVADYIHLNPARAQLAGGPHGKLTSYPWSSLRHYAKGDPPPWMELNRVLDAFQLGHERRGRTAYVEWLEARAATDDGKIDEAAMQALRNGWYLGEESFKNKLLGMVDKAKANIRKRGHHSGGAITAHNELEAERIVQVMTTHLGLPSEISELAKLKKGHPHKATCAALLRLHTATENHWIACRLAMGASSYVSLLVNRLLQNETDRRALNAYLPILHPPSHRASPTTP